MRVRGLFGIASYAFRMSSSSSILNSKDIAIPVLSKGVVLKEFTEQDASQLFKVIDRNREHLREWLFWVDATNSEENSLSFIMHSRKQREEGSALILGVFQEEKLAGTVSFVSIDKLKKKAELGYWLAHDFQGKGITTNACLALMEYGFNELSLSEIYAKSLVENSKSLNVFRTLKLFCSDEGEEEQYHRGIIRKLNVTKGTMTKENWDQLKSIYRFSDAYDSSKISITNQSGLR